MSSPVLTVMTAAVRKAARSLQRDYGELANLQVSQKAPGDYVTAADQKVDKFLREELAKVRPGYAFLTEETGAVPGTDPEHRFIIDPIDGTRAFVAGLTSWTTLIGAVAGDRPILGIIDQPWIDERYIGLTDAEKSSWQEGRGARISLKTRDCRKLTDAILSTTLEKA